MIWNSLTEDHRITKTKMLRQNHCTPSQMLPPKCSLNQSLRVKIVIPPTVAVLEKFITSPLTQDKEGRTN